MNKVNIHDNIINDYTVDFDNEKITFTTTSEDAQKTILTFHNVLAHKFDDVIKCNILFDIEEVAISDFIRENRENIDKWLNNCFPTTSNNCIELEMYLKVEKYKIFYLQSSLGISGFIISKEMEFKSV